MITIWMTVILTSTILRVMLLPGEDDNSLLIMQSFLRLSYFLLVFVCMMIQMMMMMMMMMITVMIMMITMMIMVITVIMINFSFAPVVAAVCRRFPMFVGFEANKAAEGEHLAQTLLAKKHCPQKHCR